MTLIDLPLTTDPTGDYIASSLWWVQSGFKIFPLARQSKIPSKLPGFENGFKTAVRADENTVRSWIDQTHGGLPNIGVHVGNTHLVIDLDVGIDKRTGEFVNGKVSFFDALDKHGLELPDTLTQFTARGGQHLIFELPMGKGRFWANPNSGIKNAQRLLPGLDLKGFDGYIVGAPSRFTDPDGGVVDSPYTVVDKSVPIALLPLEVVDLLIDLRSQRGARRGEVRGGPNGQTDLNGGSLTDQGFEQYLVRVQVEGFRDGERHDQFVHLIVHLKWHRYGEEQALAIVERVWQMSDHRSQGDKHPGEMVAEFYDNPNYRVSLRTDDMTGRFTHRTEERQRTEANQMVGDPNVHPEFKPPPEPGRADLFRDWSMLELLAESDVMEWLVKGLWIDPTYGQVAGEMKAMKSYINQFIQVGIASGRPIFGQFEVPRARPVVAYVGEGGRRLYRRRIQRIAEAIGVSAEDLDLHPRFETAPAMSTIFQDSLRRDLDKYAPGLVSLDPLYAYHGTETKAQDLHQEGSLLNRLSDPCMDADCSLQIVNHMNQTGTGMSLKRITQAGSGEWSDSWVLVAHRGAPTANDVNEGTFHLVIEVGSRQWGGRSWDLDLSIGRFDEDLLSHDGQITWDINPGGTGTRVDRSYQRDLNRLAKEAQISEVLNDCPFECTKTRIQDVIGGNKLSFDQAWSAMVQTNRIVSVKMPRDEGGRSVSRECWGLAGTLPTLDGESCS